VNDSEPSNFYTNSLCELNSHGKTTASVLLDAQLLLNKQQQVWGGIYIN